MKSEGKKMYRTVDHSIPLLTVTLKLNALQISEHQIFLAEIR